MKIDLTKTPLRVHLTQLGKDVFALYLEAIRNGESPPYWKGDKPSYYTNVLLMPDVIEIPALHLAVMLTHDWHEHSDNRVLFELEAEIVDTGDGMFCGKCGSRNTLVGHVGERFPGGTVLRCTCNACGHELTFLQEPQT